MSTKGALYGAPLVDIIRIHNKIIDNHSGSTDGTAARHVTLCLHPGGRHIII